MRRQPLKVAPRAHGHRTARYWHQAALPTRPSVMSVRLGPIVATLSLVLASGGPSLAQTTIGGNQNFDLQRNSRIGATFSTAVGRSQAIRASVSTGARTTIGAAFTSIALGYNYAWAQ